MEPVTSPHDKENSRVPGWLKFAVIAIAAGFFGKLFGFIGILVAIVVVFLYYAYRGYSEA